MATVYKNGRVHLPGGQMVRCLRVDGGIITHLTDDAAGLTGEPVDLEEAVVLPGLADAHLHLDSLGLEGGWLDLSSAKSAKEAITLVAETAASLPVGTWVRGRGWDQSGWPEGVFPAPGLLDAAVARHPCYLVRKDGHAVWVNKAALFAAGLDASFVSPAGGAIVRGRDGSFGGILIDNAMQLVERALPEPSAGELRQALRAALHRCAAAGLTSVHEMGTTAAMLAELDALDAGGELPVRVFSYIKETVDGAIELAASHRPRGKHCRVMGVKLYADGALGSRGAALFAPYCDCDGERGLLLHEPEELTHLARKVHRAGLQLAIHAIGDRGNHLCLDAIESAQAGEHGRRHRVEHAQVIAQDDVARFHALATVASMQPVHAAGDMSWAPARLGAARMAGAYAWRSLKDAGVPLAFGSDAPIETENPWPGILAAVTLGSRGGSVNQAVSLQQALAGYTHGAAFAVHQERRLGRLLLGACADLTIVDRDPFELKPPQLGGLRVLRTVVGGREVFAAT